MKSRADKLLEALNASKRFIFKELVLSRWCAKLISYWLDIEVLRYCDWMKDDIVW